MANTGRLTQSVLEFGTLENGAAVVTQDVLEFAVGLGIDCANPPAGLIGLAYTHTFPAGSGDPPYTFTISAGALPSGLSLAAGTGIVSGSPNVPGVFPFTVTVTDSLFAVASVACSIAIIGGTAPPVLGAGRPIRPSSCGCTPEQLEAERIRQRRYNRRAWPYVHVCSPPQTQAVHAVGFIASPALNTPTVVNAFSVPSGFAFVFQGIIQDFSGGAFVPGAAVWNVDINTEFGVLNVQSQPLQDLHSIPVPLGSLSRARVWKFKRAYELEPLTLLQSRVTNVSLGVGDPNYFTTGFFGYLILA